MSRSLLDAVLRPAEARSFGDVAAWWAALRGLDAATPLDAAVRGAVMADRVGWAFAAGYEAALWALVPGRDRSVSAALCVTEEGPPHPRSIATRLEAGALHGEKRFVTLGADAEALLVLARGDDGLVLVVVPRDADGVHLTELPATPFVPEIPHAAVRFDGAHGEVLPGDGWSDYVKPFRTVEDTYVHVSLTAWLLASARRWGFANEPIETGLACLMAMTAIAALDPKEPATHLALAGAIRATRAWVESLDFDAAPAEDRARWQRDRRLLDIASAARTARREKAWTTLGT